MKFYLICYDTPSDPRRRKFSKYLVNYMQRVQESVFEGYLRKSHFNKLHRSLQQIVCTKKDSLRIYSMSENTAQATIVYGLPTLSKNENYYLVEDVLEEFGIDDDEFDLMTSSMHSE